MDAGGEDAGDAGSPSDAADTSTDAPPQDATQVDAVRIELSPHNVLLTGAGDAWPIEARVFDAADEPLEVDVEWVIENPSVVSVDSEGMVSAEADVGSSYVTAMVGGVMSNRIFVYAAAPAADAFVVTDDEIAEEASLVGEAVLGVGTQFRFRVTGASEAVVGAPVIAREDAAVAGIVTAVDGDEITYELAPIDDLFDQLSIRVDEPVDVPRQKAIDFALGPVSCSAGASVLPEVTLVEAEVSFGTEPDGLSFVGELELGLTGISRASIRMEGEYSARTVIDVTLPDPLDAEIQCEVTEEIPIPITGPLAKIISPIVEPGVGLKLTGSLRNAEIGFRVTTQVRGEMNIGFVNEGGEFTLLDHLTRDFEGSDIELLTPDINTVSVDLGIWAHQRMGLKFGTPRVEGLQLEWATLRHGVRQSFSGLMADPLLQLQSGEATTYSAEYPIVLEPGALAQVNGIYLLYSLISGNNEFSVEPEIAHSPHGTLSVDALQIAPDDVLSLEVLLQDESYLGLYNVQTVRLFHRKVGEDWTQIDETIAVEGQTSFPFIWTPELDDFGVHQFAALVVTRLFPPLPLEVAPDSVQNVTVVVPGSCFTRIQDPAVVPGVVARGINNAGVIFGHDRVSGECWLLAPEDGDYFRDDDMDGVNDLIQRLPLTPGNRCTAGDINDSGTLVGSMAIAAEDNRTAGFYGDASGLNILPRPVSDGRANLRAVNAGGTAVGSADVDFMMGSVTWPVTTAGAAMTQVGMPTGVSVGLFDINDSGVMVGGTQNGTPSGAIIADGGFQPLPTLSGLDRSIGSANAINNSGRVVGFEPSPAGGGERVAVYWEGGSVTILEGRGGSSDEALDVNNAGHIVGQTQDAVSGVERPTLWLTEPAYALPAGITMMGDLSSSPEFNTAGWAQAINDMGRVIGGNIAQSWVIDLNACM